MPNARTTSGKKIHAVGLGQPAASAVFAVSHNCLGLGARVVTVFALARLVAPGFIALGVQGVTALVLAMQPLVTAVVSSRFLGERLGSRQWAGVALGLAGVALVVWHKVDVRSVTAGSLAGIFISLAAVTAGTLYQRTFCPHADLRSAALVQFAASFAVLAPAALAIEGFPVRWSASLALSIAYLVIGSSIFGVSALHTLMRRGQATRVTSMLYLTPVVAVALEALFFGVVPTALTGAGIAIACAGVALVTRR